MSSNISYKSFCWNLGTTSFRTKDFNRTIEEQLGILDKFWDANFDVSWTGNVGLQSNYYDFMKNNGFVVGNASNKPKDAREKTSGLIDIGLIYNDRKLTDVGKTLLDISNRRDFKTDNPMFISKDSFIYLKQLLKSSCVVNNKTVRPFIIFLYVLNKLEYMSLSEFTYLLPLCISEVDTERTLEDISKLRNNETTIDQIIISRLLEKDNYKQALDTFLNNDVTENLICDVGMNRKSRSYDKPYFTLYNNIKNLYIDKRGGTARDILKTLKEINVGLWWKNYIFKSIPQNHNKIQLDKHLKLDTVFNNISDEQSFKTAFFTIMHLFKAKSTLKDYLDLNRRYFMLSDIVLFNDNTVKLDTIPKYFFKSVIDDLYKEAYVYSDMLTKNCSLNEISNCLIFNEKLIVESINNELNTNAGNLNDLKNVMSDIRHNRFDQLIESKFSKDKLIVILKLMRDRNDDETIRDMVTDNADVPTIFEYIIGITIYKISDKQGDILKAMNLDLDANLLPKTHASGGVADIIYEYDQTKYYPKHTLLVEATLSTNTGQRKMEIEPVSRHLGKFLLVTGNMDSYCMFVTGKLDLNVASSFRNDKTLFYYDNNNSDKFVKGMKIIPLEIDDVISIIENNIKYGELYKQFEEAFNDSDLYPKEWLVEYVQNKIRVKRT